MNIPRFLLPTVLALTCLVSTGRSAHAAFITYDNRTDFNANSFGRTDLEFETADPSDVHEYGATANFGDVTFGGTDLYSVDSELDPGVGTGDAFGELAPGVTGPVTVNFSTNVSAVGLDFGGYGADPGNTFDFIVNGQTYTSQVGQTFFGFTADAPITSFSFSTNTGSPLIDNFSFGTSNSDTAGVPEPSTYAMMLLGLGTIGLIGWKRKGGESTEAEFAAAQI